MAQWIERVAPGSDRPAPRSEGWGVGELSGLERGCGLVFGSDPVGVVADAGVLGQGDEQVRERRLAPVPTIGRLPLRRARPRPDVAPREPEAEPVEVAASAAAPAPRAVRLSEEVLLVGDWGQRQPPGAGGSFAMLVHARDDAPELLDIQRFTNEWEKTTSLQLRHGRAEAIDTLIAHNRITGGDEEALSTPPTKCGEMILRLGSRRSS